MAEETENRNGNDPSADPLLREVIGRRWTVLAILFLVYLTSSMDRIIVSIAGQPIKTELGLADWQLGLLNGFAFSLLYIVLGVPLARLADRGNRVNIISTCLCVWSAMTALCGAVSSFAQLVAFRMGVGVGEAGCLPTSHSLIGDYFPQSQRTTALALFGLALPLGGLGGMILGGMIVDAFGWRAAFLLLGIPGLLLAAILKMVVREPPRSDSKEGAGAAPSSRQPPEMESLGHVLTFLARSKPARNVLLGVTLATMFTSPSITFLAPLMARGFDLSYSQIGLLLGLAQMGGIALSTFLGGILCDHLGKRDRRWYLWVPAGSLLLGAPLFALAYAQTAWPAFITLLFLASLTGAAYLPPSYAVLYTLVKPRWRATTAATVGVLMNLIGLSVGPILCGLAIDMLTAYNLGLLGAPGLASACIHGAAADMTDAAQAALCTHANVDATRTALILFSAGLVLPILNFLQAGRAYRKSELAPD